MAFFCQVLIISRIVEFRSNWSYFCNHQSIHVVRLQISPDRLIMRVLCVLTRIRCNAPCVLYALLVRGAGCHGFDGIGGCFQLANPARCSPNAEMNALDARRSWACIQSCTSTGHRLNRAASQARAAGSINISTHQMCGQGCCLRSVRALDRTSFQMSKTISTIKLQWMIKYD